MSDEATTTTPAPPPPPKPMGWAECETLGNKRFVATGPDTGSKYEIVPSSGGYFNLLVDGKQHGKRGSVKMHKEAADKLEQSLSTGEGKEPPPEAKKEPEPKPAATEPKKEPAPEPKKEPPATPRTTEKSEPKKEEPKPPPAPAPSVKTTGEEDDLIYRMGTNPANEGEPDATMWLKEVLKDKSETEVAKGLRDKGLVEIHKSEAEGKRYCFLTKSGLDRFYDLAIEKEIEREAKKEPEKKEEPKPAPAPEPVKEKEPEVKKDQPPQMIQSNSLVKVGSLEVGATFVFGSTSDLCRITKRGKYETTGERLNQDGKVRPIYLTSECLVQRSDQPWPDKTESVPIPVAPIRERKGRAFPERDWKPTAELKDNNVQSVFEWGEKVRDEASDKGLFATIFTLVCLAPNRTAKDLVKAIYHREHAVEMTTLEEFRMLNDQQQAQAPTEVKKIKEKKEAPTVKVVKVKVAKPSKKKEPAAEEVDEKRHGIRVEVRPGENGGRQRIRIFGMSVTKILRWMGNDAWTFTDAKRALKKLDLDVAESTITSQMYSGKNGNSGKRGEIPELTEKQEGLLYDLLD